MRAILQQAWRAATLDRRAFGDWLYSSSATGDAALLVVGVMLAQWIAVTIGILIGDGGLGALDLVGLLSFAISALAEWFFLGAATWFAGTRLFGGSGDWQGVLRLHGLAYLPRVLSVLVVVGGSVAAWAPVVGYVWHLVALVVASAVALSLKTRDAVLSVLIGAAIIFAIRFLISGTFGVVGGLFGGLN
jgi:hypothetical protein